MRKSFVDFILILLFLIVIGTLTPDYNFTHWQFYIGTILILAYRLNGKE